MPQFPDLTQELQELLELTSPRHLQALKTAVRRWGLWVLWVLGGSFLVMAIVGFVAAGSRLTFPTTLLLALGTEVIGYAVITTALGTVGGPASRSWLRKALAAIFLLAGMVLLFLASPLHQVTATDGHQVLLTELQLGIGAEIVVAALIFFVVDQILSRLVEEEQERKKLVQRINEIVAQISEATLPTQRQVEQLTSENQRLADELQKCKDLRTQVVGLLSDGAGHSADEIRRTLHFGRPSGAAYVTVDEVLAVIGELSDEGLIETPTAGRYRMRPRHGT